MNLFVLNYPAPVDWQRPKDFRRRSRQHDVVGWLQFAGHVIHGKILRNILGMCNSPAVQHTFISVQPRPMRDCNHGVLSVSPGPLI